MKQPVPEGSMQLGAVGAESWGQSWPGCGLERYHGQVSTESQVQGFFFFLGQSPEITHGTFQLQAQDFSTSPSLRA